MRSCPFRFRRRPADAVSVNSPDGHVQFRLVLEKQGSLAYALTLRGKTAIETSPLGIVVDGVNLGQGAQVGKTDRYKVNETYAWHGVHSTVAVRANGVRIVVTRERSGAQYTLEARAYNDGIAFRFIVPGPEGRSRVPDEATTFRLPAGSTVWYHDFEGHYEGAHVRKNLQEVTALDWAAPPLTVKLPNGAGYASITEGALLHYLGDGTASRRQRRLRGAARPRASAFVSFPVAVQRRDRADGQAGFGCGCHHDALEDRNGRPDLNTLVNCDIVADVAPPPIRICFRRASRPNGSNPAARSGGTSTVGRTPSRASRNFHASPENWDSNTRLSRGFGPSGARAS